LVRKFKHNPVKEEFLITESAFDDDCTNGRIKIIESGFNQSESRFYTENAIKNGAKIFEGVKMYANHDYDGSESKKLGTRDIRNWVATIDSVESGIGSDNKVAAFGNVKVHSKWFKDFIKETKESGVLNQVGVSIDAFGVGERRAVDKVFTNVIEGFSGANSVDFVSTAGAGGKMLSFQEANTNKGDFDMEKMTLEELKESNPTLVSELIKEASTNVIKELKEAEKKKADDIKAKEAAANKDEAKDKKVLEANDLFKLRAEFDRKEMLGSMLTESELQKEVKDRIKESVLLSNVVIKESKLDIEITRNQIAKIVESEENYYKKLIEYGAKGNGGQSKKDDSVKSFKESLEKCFEAKAGLEIKEKGGKK